eukprot:scaffold2868_cov171-Amphora_coffeaeformis.AAC.2
MMDETPKEERKKQCFSKTQRDAHGSLTVGMALPKYFADDSCNRRKQLWQQVVLCLQQRYHIDQAVHDIFLRHVCRQNASSLAVVCMSHCPRDSRDRIGERRKLNLRR